MKTTPGMLQRTGSVAGRYWLPAEQGVTLIELTVVVLIIFILGVFSVRALDPTPTARAQQLYSTAARMANGWMLLAASCGTSPDTAASPLPASGATPADVLTRGAASINAGYANCYRAANVNPMDDVVRTVGGSYTIGGLPFAVSGGGAAPFVATFNAVPAEVATRLAIQYAGSRVSLPLPATNQSDTRVRWQLQPDGTYQVAILFHDEVATAASASSPWAAVGPASVAVAGVAGPARVQLAALSPGGVPQQQSSPSGQGLIPQGPAPQTGAQSGSAPAAGAPTAGTPTPAPSPCGGAGSTSTSPNSNSASGNNLSTSGNGTTTGSNANTTSAGNGTATGTGNNNNTTTSNGNVSQNGTGCTSASTATPNGSGSANTTSLGSGSATGPNATTTTTNNSTSTTTTTNNGAGSGSTTSTAISTGSQSASAGGASPATGNGSGGINLSTGNSGAASGNGNSTNSLPTCINGICF